MAGDERFLTGEFLDTVRGKKPRSDYWKKSQGEEAYFSGNGSQNIWLFRWAMQVIFGMPTTSPELVYGYQLGTGTGEDEQLISRQSESGRRDIMLAVPREGDTVYPSGFGGSEFGSFIYWFWHLIVHAGLMRMGNSRSEGAYAFRWLVINWLYFRAIEAPDGGILLAGMRSAGHNPCIPREVNWLYTLISGGDVKQAEAWCKQAGAGLRRSWEYEIALELLPELRQSWEIAKDIPLDRLPSMIKLRAPMTIIRTEGGLAWTIDYNVNPNTGPVLGMKWESGARTSFPDKGGPRIRQKFDHAGARIDEGGGRMIYSSTLHTGGREIEMALPAGNVIWKLRLGEEGATSDDSVPALPDSGPDPISPAVPSSDNRTERTKEAAELLAGLQLSNRHRAERDFVLSQFAAGEVTTADILLVRGWFRPDSPQKQAVEWRKALEILESI